MRLILAVSLRRWRSFPNDFIQGFESEPVACERSLSARASETRARKGMPRSAAADLARRKMASGISNVVFIAPYSHIYGSMSIQAALFALGLRGSGAGRTRVRIATRAHSRLRLAATRRRSNQRESGTA